jgi:hypothetical protein
MHGPLNVKFNIRFLFWNYFLISLFKLLYIYNRQTCFLRDVDPMFKL